MADEISMQEKDFAASELCDLIHALWRIERRVLKHEQTADSIKMAIETAMDRVRSLGFTVDEMVGAPYHESMRVKVIQHDTSEGKLRISECLSPAIYYRKNLIRPAEVIIEGEFHDSADS
jgi:hypothetical protein